MAKKGDGAGEEALKRSVERLEALIEEAPIGVINVDTKGKITYVNKTLLQATGYLGEELVGKNAFRLGLFPRETLKVLGRRLKEKVRGKPPSPLEIQFKRKDGGWMWVEISGRALWEHGLPVGIQIVGQDITERKRMEEELRLVESAVKASISAVSITDLNGKLIYVNPALVDMFGYDNPDAMLGKNVISLAKEKEKVQSIIETMVAGGPNVVELIGIRKDGTEIIVEIRVSIVTDARGQSISMIASLVDITERKKMEEELRVSENKYRQLFESTLDGMLVIDAETMGVVVANQAAVRMYGFNSVDDIIGVKPFDFIPPEDRERVFKIIAKDMFEDDLQQINEFRTITKDGREIWISAVGVRTEYRGKLAGLVSFRDITERKRLQEQLVRSEKLAAIGQLAGGVGHELRNPLGAIKNAVYYIRGKVAKSELGQKEPRVMEFLGILDDEVNASNKIINDLLGFSRVGKPSVSPTRIKKVIEDALSRIAIPDNIQLTKMLDADLPEVEIDADQIQQVLVNIITNAVEAMPEGGKLAIGAREKDRFLEVKIADTGCGIPQEAVDKIFDPLFTTKAKGIGLDLAVCKTMIDRHEGNIQVESQVGKGTTFTIRLPLEAE